MAIISERYCPECEEDTLFKETEDDGIICLGCEKRKVEEEVLRMMDDKGTWNEIIDKNKEDPE